MSKRIPIVNPQFGSDDFQENIHLHYRDYIKNTPVFMNDEGVVYVTRHEDCSRLLGGKQFKRNPPDGMGPFSKAGQDIGSVEKTVSQWMIFMDQPRHDVVRKAFSMPFTPKAISEIEPFILRRTHELLARISIDGETELLRNFAFLLPIVVIAEILGVPSSDTEQFYQWSAKLTAAIDSATPQDVEAGAEVIQTMTNYFAPLLKQAEKLPQHSLIRMLHNDPMQLTASELNSGLLFLLVAGHETTKGLISNGILLFANHPKVFREIKQHRELIPKAMEEVLRYDSPVQKMSRWTHEEVVFGDYTIPVGTTMTALIGAAHQDPSVFQQPELFNINRDDNRHLAFGVGLHRCLGSTLARLEAKIAFEAIFSVIKELRPVQHRWRTISALRCLDELVVHAVPE